MNPARRGRVELSISSATGPPVEFHVRRFARYCRVAAATWGSWGSGAKKPCFLKTNFMSPCVSRVGQ